MLIVVSVTTLLSGQASQCILDDNELTLFDYNITNGDTLLLKVDEGECTTINVQYRLTRLQTTLHSGTMGGSNFCDLVSECPGCPGISSCDILIRCMEISYIYNASNDAWSALCDIFNIKRNVIKIIRENSDSPAVRCADVVHRLFHADHTLTWNNIKLKLKQRYLHLVEEM